MDLKNVAILGYGNQGRAHALNLRDSGVQVTVGARPGKGAEQAKKDDFTPLPPADAAKGADIVMLLFPDSVIPLVAREIEHELRRKPFVGFAHGFAYHFEKIEKSSDTRYFLCGPKGAGAILREHYEKRVGLPGVYAVSHDERAVEAVAKSYAKAIGLSSELLIRTTFQEEVECDLFGEQAVLCGGIFQLMEAAFDTLRRNGHSSEMAFLETCFEAEMILKLWMKFGPSQTANQISPTAFYGGLTRGRRIVTEETKAELQRIFDEIRSGKFAAEWLASVERGSAEAVQEKARLKDSALEAAYQAIKSRL